MKNDITKLNAYEIADLLRLKKIDPVYLLESFFNNYKSSTKEKRYAISKELKTDALKEAKRSWVRQKKNTRLSLLDGIPTGWKDIINIKGYQTLAGSRALEKINNKIQSTDAEIVGNSKKKGLVSLFKTSTVEFAFGGLGINNSVPFTFNHMIGKKLCPGGSSSGSAAAVYSNFIPLSVGSDTAGSIRIPSAWHSLVGFKPTYGSLPCKGILHLSKSYDTLGTICKSIEDTKIFFSLLSNKKLNFSIPNIKKFRIGVIDDFIINELVPRERENFETLLELLLKADFNLVRIKVPEFNIINTEIFEVGGPVNYEAWNTWKDKIKDVFPLIDKNVLSRFIIGKNIEKKDMQELKNKIFEYKKKIYKNFNNIDFFLTPTVSIGPPKVKDVLKSEKYIIYNNKVLNNTRIANLFNFCAVSIPIKKKHWLAVSLLGQEKNDVLLLSMAKKIETTIKSII